MRAGEYCLSLLSPCFTNQCPRQTLEKGRCKNPIMQSVFSAAARRTSSSDGFVPRRAALVRKKRSPFWKIAAASGHQQSFVVSVQFSDYVGKGNASISAFVCEGEQLDPMLCRIFGMSLKYCTVSARCNSSSSAIAGRRTTSHGSCPSRVRRDRPRAIDA